MSYPTVAFLRYDYEYDLMESLTQSLTVSVTLAVTNGANVTWSRHGQSMERGVLLSMTGLFR